MADEMASEDRGGMRKVLIWVPLLLFLAFIALFASGLFKPDDRIIHSRLVDHMTYMGKLMDTTLYVKNGPSLAGNGAGGEGYGNYSIACASGEGVTTPLTYTRFRRCTMVDNLRIV